jgi:hypothetical protein
MPIILPRSRTGRTPWHGQLQVLLELSITVENKGELIDCLTKQHLRKPGANSLSLVTHRRHSLQHGIYGGDGSQDVGCGHGRKPTNAEDGLSKFYD